MTLPRREVAPAKLNLALHVTGRRPDGYHMLDSLVVFLDIGDVVTLAEGPLSLTLTGPFGAALAGPKGDAELDDNLCIRAARLAGREVAITLEKNLPVAAGLGGGSADAAAVLRALGARPPRPEALGADLPVCLAGRPARMRGVGEILDPLGPLPPLHLVLVNPGAGLATPRVFAALERRDNPPLPAALPPLHDSAAAIALLGRLRNDLEPAAVALMPVIAECLAALTAAGAGLARMSGSGATSFGLFATAAAADRAADRIRAAAPRGWWIARAGLAPLPATG